VLVARACSWEENAELTFLINNAYRQISSTEVWTENTIAAIFHLLDYYLDLNCFEKKETFPLLCLQLLQLIENIEKLAEKEGVNVTSIKLYTINGIFTSNDYFCSKVEK
jgi:hypothetical protein